MGEMSKEYTVEVTGKETVAAVLPLQEHWLSLSNLDLLLPPLDVGVFLCYENPCTASKKKKKKPPQQQHADGNGDAGAHSLAEMVSGLKASLARALVTYYPFAGEVVVDSMGEPELLCNNRGVDFVEAYADVELKDLALYDPDESVEGKLVPKKTAGVLCVQVTELKCGGLVVACTFDHRIADAYSADMFLVAWSETASSQPLSAAPSFRRSLLSPRRRARPDPSLDRLYTPISSLLPPKPLPAGRRPVNRIYYIGASDVARMQEAACSGGRRRSKLESFVAYLWRLIGKASSRRWRARVSKMGVVVNGRSRLMDSTLKNYFGNVLSIPYGSLGVEELEVMDVTQVADAVHEFVEKAVTEEHFRGLIDWVEACRPEPAAASIYCGAGEEEEVAVVVSSGRGFPVGEVEFGWGKAAFGSYHFPWGGGAGYVMPMPSPKGGGDWVVYMHIMEGLVEELEAEAGGVFRPLTAEYLGLLEP